MKTLGRQIWEYRDTGEKVVVSYIDKDNMVWFWFLPKMEHDGKCPLGSFRLRLKFVGWEDGPFPRDDLHSCPVCGGEDDCLMMPSLLEGVYMGSKCHGTFKPREQG